MSLLDVFTYRRAGNLLAAGDMPLSTPWADQSGLTRFSIAEITGLDLNGLTITRADALTIPAVNRARNLIVSAIASQPLKALKADGTDAEQPTWMYRSDSGVSPYMRTARTVDSLMFYGRALWWVNRSDADGSILTADWLPESVWTVTNGQILINEKPVSEQNIIYFDHIGGGLVNEAVRTLRSAIDVERAVGARARSPIPLTVIKSTSTTADLGDDEIADLLKQYRAAINADTSVAYLPSDMDVIALGSTDPGMYTEARNAFRADIANFCNVPTSMLDGSLSEASLTYTTTEGNRNRFYTESLPFWYAPIEQTLSQDLTAGGALPRGQRARFDFSDLYAPTPSPTGPIEQD